MPGPTTLILAATVPELRPVIRRFRLGCTGGLEWSGRSNGHALLAAVTGIGPGCASAAADRLVTEYSPRRLLITGTAGATSPSLPAGHILIPGVVIDDKTGRTFRPTMPVDSAGTLLSAGAIVTTPHEKARLYAAHGADAVDMETASVAAVCDRHGVPWAAVRAILDPADAALPADLTRLTRPDGRTNVPAAIAYILRHPGRLPLLVRLGRDTVRVMTTAAERIAALL